MSRRLSLIALALATVAAPAAADEPPSTGGAQAPASPAAQGVITASGAQVTLAARAGAMHGRVAHFRGSAPAGSAVALERLDATGAWTVLARTTTAADGTYAAHWRTSGLGAHRVRAVIDRQGGAAAATAVPELGITVHRPALATWYGPGFYGRRTACGQRMTRTLQGVAHKTLPCGTKVSLLYRGRRLTVPVVDRGPYVADRSWDLTAATAAALRFTYTDRVGAVRVQSR